MSSAGRCIARSTSSGMVVGPGIARNSRPARTVIVVLPCWCDGLLRGSTRTRTEGVGSARGFYAGWMAKKSARSVLIESEPRLYFLFLTCFLHTNRHPPRIALAAGFRSKTRYRLVSRQPAASASSTEQNQRVPFEICILIFAYQRLVGW